LCDLILCPTDTRSYNERRRFLENYKLYKNVNSRCELRTFTVFIRQEYGKATDFRVLQSPDRQLTMNASKGVTSLHYASSAFDHRSSLEPRRPFIQQDLSRQVIQDSSPASRPFIQDSSPASRPFIQDSSPASRPFIPDSSPASRPFIQDTSSASRPFVQNSAPALRPFIQESSPATRQFIQNPSPTTRQFIQESTPATRQFIQNSSHGQRPVVTSPTRRGIQQLHHHPSSNPANPLYYSSTASFNESPSTPSTGQQQHGSPPPNVAPRRRLSPNGETSSVHKPTSSVYQTTVVPLATAKARQLSASYHHLGKAPYQIHILNTSP